jgi:hypothetical protein
LERNERRGGGAGGARRPKQRESIEHAMGVANRFLMPPPFLSSVMRCPSAFLTHTGTSPATHKPAAPLGCINQPHPSKPRSHLAHMHPVCPHRQRHIHPVVDEKRHPPPATHGQHGGGLLQKGPPVRLLLSQLHQRDSAVQRQLHRLCRPLCGGVVGLSMCMILFSCVFVFLVFI